MPSFQPAPTTLQGGKPWYKCPGGAMILGEAPVYRQSDSTLHWVDVLNPEPSLHVLELDGETLERRGEERVILLKDSVSVFAFRQGKKGYICATYGDIAYMDEDGKLEVLKVVIPENMKGERRFNDGGVDRKGRFWVAENDKGATPYGLAGVPKEYGEPKGRLWKYDVDGTLTEMDKGFVCGNGVKWSLDDKIMYMNDSVGQKTYAYDFDLESGTIKNKRLLVDHSGTEGEPDGLVVDTDGNLWMSVYGTNRVMAFDPTGKHLKDIEFSGKRLTCPTWAGKNLDTLFITSAVGDKEDVKRGDYGGHVFRFKPEGVKGLVKYEFGG